MLTIGENDLSQLQITLYKRRGKHNEVRLNQSTSLFLTIQKGVNIE